MLENNKTQPPNIISFGTKSSKQKLSTAIAKKWHKRLGHMAYESINQSPNNVDGVEIIDYRLEKEK